MCFLIHYHRFALSSQLCTFTIVCYCIYLNIQSRKSKNAFHHPSLTLIVVIDQFSIFYSSLNHSTNRIELLIIIKSGKYYQQGRTNIMKDQWKKLKTFMTKWLRFVIYFSLVPLINHLLACIPFYWHIYYLLIWESILVHPFFRSMNMLEHNQYRLEHVCLFASFFNNVHQTTTKSGLATCLLVAKLLPIYESLPQTLYAYIATFEKHIELCLWKQSLFSHIHSFSTIIGLLFPFVWLIICSNLYFNSIYFFSFSSILHLVLEGDFYQHINIVTISAVIEIN